MVHPSAPAMANLNFLAYTIGQLACILLPVPGGAPPLSSLPLARPAAAAESLQTSGGLHSCFCQSAANA